MEGEHFLDYARRIVDLEHSAISELSNLNHYTESLRIGSTNTIYDCHLIQPFLRYQREHPDISLSISINHSLPLIQMLQDHILDLVFTYVPHKKNDICSSIFATDPLVLVTSAANTVNSRGIYQAQLLEDPYYYCDFPFQELGSYIKNLFPKNHPFPLTMDRSANLLPFLTQGNGYSFLPHSLIAPFLANGSLIAIDLLDFEVPPVNCYMEYCADTPILHRINEFSKLLSTK
jgi:LysR family transcriptional repressor of citA